jgi:uncharacterized protein YjbI with pentapeptide repeats
MAVKEHVEVLELGVDAWNAWRRENRSIRPDLQDAIFHKKNLVGVDFRGADLRKTDFHRANLSQANLRGARLLYSNLFEANLQGVDLRGGDLREIKSIGAMIRHANLSGVNLQKANLYAADLSETDLSRARLESAQMSGGAILRKAILTEAKLTRASLKGAILDGANLTGANLYETDLSKASLVGADLSHADLSEADLQKTDLSEAIFTGADLSKASLVKARLYKTNLNNCRVYGCPVWDVEGEPASQKDLIISPKNEDDINITTDDIEVAQFIYLMYDNKKIRNVINSITSKGILILGRFSPPERKTVLDGLRDKLRDFNLLPIVFDFDRPTDKDYTETVQTLAGMSLFVIADMTSPRSIPLELEATVKQFKIPYVPILDKTVESGPFSMFWNLKESYHWVLEPFGYESKEQLLDNVKAIIIDRAIEKHNELRKQKAVEHQVLTLNDLIQGKM